MSKPLSILKTLAVAAGGGALGAILAVVLLAAIIAGVAVSAVQGETRQRPSGDVVLTLDLRERIPDMSQPSSVPFLSSGNGFVDIVTRLHRASQDDRVRGIFVRIGYGGPGSARAEELRTAFLALREAGKFVVAHAQGFGIRSSGYLAASAADDIVLQPGSEFSVSGLMIETMFLKDMLGKINVVPDMIAVGEYKNAPNTLTESDFTLPHAEALEQVGRSIWDNALADIALDRELDPLALRALLVRSPHSDTAALSLGLVDSLSWPEETLDAALMRQGACDDPCDKLRISDYLPPSSKGDAPVIAVIGGEGEIVTGDGNAATGRFVSDQVADELLSAADDEDVAAVVFRVDSPGGSVDASEQVWRAVARVQDAGKPVVVSMGPLAASGGYYVSMGADAILASRATITGSIGVFGGKLAIGGGLRELGIEPRRIVVGGDFASIGSTESFTPSQRDRITKALRRIYDRFVSQAAQGRQLPKEQVDAAARGRVWSGSDAVELGLIDGIGGFVKAVDMAKQLAGIDPDQPVQLKRYTQPDDPLRLAQLVLASGGSLTAGITLLGMLADVLADSVASGSAAQARMMPVTIP